ncbi:MAG: hypothetical protein IJR99_12285 [Kiritimatiellae bacterium]|nr:hypothetical protein [Kiritimatiellia bacterium]
MKTIHSLLSALLIPLAASSLAGVMPDMTQVNCPGSYSGHLQDVCTDGTYLYWAHTVALIKTDLRGNEILKVSVPNHHAGIVELNGTLYVAVCPLSDMNAPQVDHPVEVWLYNAETLQPLEQKVLPQIDRAGSIALTPDGFLVGCLRDAPRNVLTKRQIRIHRYDRQFNHLESRIIDCPFDISMGTEVIKYNNGHFWLAIYNGHVHELDENLNSVASYSSQGQTGMIFDGKWFWYGVTNSKNGLYTSYIKRVESPFLKTESVRGSSAQRSVIGTIDARDCARLQTTEQPLDTYPPIGSRFTVR